MKEDCYLRKDVKEELANNESGWVTKMRSLLDSYGMSNLILNMLKVLNGEIDKKKYKKKNNHKFFQKTAKDCSIQTLLYTYKNEKNNFFSQTKEVFEKERYLNLHNFNNRNVITKIRLPSHNLAKNTTQWYNLQGEIKISKNCEEKEIEDEIHIIFSCNKFDNIRRKAFNDINEVDKIKLQIGNKVEKLKFFFLEGSLKTRNILDNS